MKTPFYATKDIQVLPSYIPIPGYGILPTNAFLIKGGEPILVDAGIRAESDDFYSALNSVIDPR